MRLAVTVLAIALLASACTTVDPPNVTPTLTETTTTSPTAQPTAVDVLPEGLQQAQVTRVIDGDTIDVLLDGETVRVRYIGIDTPETVDPRRPVGCFGDEASDRNKQLVDGQTVGLERDVSETDAFGRLLRYVWVDPSTGSGRAVMVNAALVEEGYALASTYPPDVKHSAMFAALQARARDTGRGLWSACATPEPSPAADGACQFSGTDEPLIKGNISQSSGERIYHVPGSASYDGTTIDESSGERWFCSEEDAVAAGWRKSRQ
ncbi:MAG: thermonuclease family protein [Dehalococcoidia bacterium]